VYGYVGFRSLGWDEVVFEGPVEPSWIQGRIDARVQKELAAFEKSYQRGQHLPAWLLDAPARPAATKERRARDPLDEPPVPVPASLSVEYLEAMLALATDEHAKVLTAVDALRAKEAPEALLTFLSAQARHGLHETKAALEDVDRTLALAPNHLGSMVLRAILLGDLGKDEEAAGAFRAAATAHPTVPSLFEAACLRLLLAGQATAARAMAEDAARRGHRSKTLDLLGSALAKAEHGPDWPKVHEYRSSNYHVFSDIDAATCRDASKVLEEAFTAFRAHLRWVNRDRTRLFKVYLFAGQGGFGSYVEDVVVLGGKAPEHVAGLYSPVLKQLLIWNLPSRDEMMRTVRHEGFHQYLDRLLPDPPVWFDEGLAVYYENLERVDGQWKYGSPDREGVAMLRKEGLLPLSKFLALSRAQFYAGGHRSYGQAWLFVHMMRHGTSRHRALFQALMDRLETEQAHPAVRAVFDEKTLEALDADLVKHLATMP
jgi:hypothetical protein